jgi:hypothetical protein
MDGSPGMNGGDGMDGTNGMDGVDGMNGADGMDGVDGVDGMDGDSCWDTNDNQTCDTAEDVNADTVCDILDCQGSDGADGGDGDSCWDVNDNLTCDPSEDVNSDTVCNYLDCAGAPGPAGPTGPSGVISSAYANGFGTAPADSSTATYAFISVTAVVNVSGPNQALIVDASRALGSIAATGAQGLVLTICRQTNGTGVLTDNGFDYMAGLRVPQNTRVPFGMSTRWSNLPVGSYTVGLCGYTNTGQAVNWNSNEWSRVTAIVAQQ